MAHNIYTEDPAVYLNTIHYITLMLKNFDEPRLSNSRKLNKKPLRSFLVAQQMRANLAKTPFTKQVVYCWMSRPIHLDIENF